MQTEKFTIFDFDKLQAPEKQEHYQEIIAWAVAERNKYTKRNFENYTARNFELCGELPISFYIKKANELIQNKKRTVAYNTPVLNTANEKMLFITNFIFPDMKDFKEKLNFYGMDDESCLNFSEAIKDLKSLDKQQATLTVNMLINEYLSPLNFIKTHYGTNNTGLIINKILEIAYLHPELLQTKKQKS